jgi:hypothetical protein
LCYIYHQTVQFGADGLISIEFFKTRKLTQIYFFYKYCEIYKISVFTSADVAARSGGTVAVELLMALLA